jgi:VanZ family protein
MDYKKFLIYWLPVILYAVFIFYLSSQSALVEPDFVSQISFKDKIYHIFEYALLSFLILRMLKAYEVKHAYALAIVLATAFGVTDELHQLLVPGRFFSILDMMANFIGSSIILLIRGSRVFYLDKLLERKK